MRLYELLEVDFKHEDQKGRLIQLVNSGFKQINVLVSYRGAKRGGHFHQTTKEAFYVISGSVDVKLVRKNEKEIVHFNEGDFFVINPNITHEMSFPEDCVMVVLYEKPVTLEDGTRDIIKAD